MFKRAMKKIYKNKWIYLALLLGLVLSIISVIVMPMFSRASQDRALKEILKEYNIEQGVYPLSVNYTYTNDEVTKEFIENSDEISLQCSGEYSLSVLSVKKLIETKDFLFWEKGRDVVKNPNFIEKGFNLISFENLEDKIKIVKGRMVSESLSEDGVYEVIMHKDIYNKSNLDMNVIYSTNLDSQVEEVVENIYEHKDKQVAFKIVGLYEMKDEEFWTGGTWNPGYTYLLTNFKTHKKILELDKSRFQYINEYIFDYRNIKYSEITHEERGISTIFENNKEIIKKNGGNQYLPLVDSIESIEAEMNSTLDMMFIIFLPLMFMLIIYVYMLSNIIADNDSNEISLLKSRGATLKNVFSTYIIQGIAMGIIGLVLAPLIAKEAVSLMGVTTEFLEFGNVQGLSSYVVFEDYMLGIIVIIFFIITMLVPVYFKSKKTIVELKRDRLRVNERAFWKKYFIDVVIVIFSAYSYFSFVLREGDNSNSSDPIIYLVITGMCLGTSLLFLRIYPYMIKLLFYIGKRIWKAETYYVFLNSSRDSGKKECIMFFLIFTLSIGIFNMSSARKINKEGVDNISYSNGADVIVRETWSDGANGFIEPPNDRYENVEGVAEACKVFRRATAKLESDEIEGNKYNLMAIEPYKFGKVAWMREDLFPRHWYDYLNAITLNPNGILVSNSLIERGYEVGGDVILKIGEKDFEDDPFMEWYEVPCKIIGTFEYWPSWNSDEDKYLIIADFDSVFKHINDVLKYEVWLDKEDEFSSKDIYNNIWSSDITIELFEDSEGKINRFKEDIFVQTINGAYSFAFIMNLIITFTGFIVYWILSVKQRALQFGILRALGLGKLKIYKMMSIEQILSTFTSLVVGLFIGRSVFNTIGSITNNNTIQGNIQLPIYLEHILSDYVAIISLVIIMIVVVIIIIIMYISKLKINQAIKLGED